MGRAHNGHVGLRERLGSHAFRAGTEVGGDASSRRAATASPGAVEAMSGRVRAAGNGLVRYGRRWLPFDDEEQPASRTADESLALLRAELVLLRTENARLKIALQRDPDLASVLRLSRARRDSGAGDAEDDPEQLMTEALVLRQSLLEICEELEQTMVAIKAKLHRLAPAADESVAVDVSVRRQRPR